MRSVAASDDSEIVQDPLWNLMLSTNDCYPGCTCDDDFFDMTIARVYEWVKQNGETTVQQALTQLDELLSTATLNVEGLSNQTNYWFEDEGDATVWLSQWRSLLAEAARGSK